jgi:hypothetical protein
MAPREGDVAGVRPASLKMWMRRHAVAVSDAVVGGPSIVIDFLDEEDRGELDRASRQRRLEADDAAVRHVADRWRSVPGPSSPC